MSESVAQQVSFGIIPITDPTDIFNGNPVTPPVNMRKAREASVVLQTISAGAGLGKGQIRAFCCSDLARSNAEEIDYIYSKSLSGAAFDEWQKATAGASSRVETATVNGALNDQYIATVRANQCKEGKPYVYFQLFETTDAPVVGRAMLFASKLVRVGRKVEDVLA